MKDNILGLIISVIGSAIALVGLWMTLDSRRLVKKYFNFGEENIATLGMKIMGVVVITIGGIILLSVKL